jgi:hypothetical protein
MQTVMRPYVAFAGAAMLGVGVIAVNPAIPHPDLEQGLASISDASVRLANFDTLDLGNIAWNLFAGVVDLPYYEYADPITLASGLTGDYSGLPGYEYLSEPSAGSINALANSLDYAGNWWQLTSTNVLGTDPGDPPKVLALAELLTGNPAVGESIGQQFNILQEAWLPLVQGCVSASVGGCPDPNDVLTSYFEVSPQQLESGYTFPDAASGLPGSVNPVPFGEPIPPGFPYGTTIPIPPGELGSNPANIELPWAGQTVTLNPDSPIEAYWNYLNGPDQPLEFPTLTQVADAYQHLFTSVFNAFNPFVPGTYCLVCAPFVPGDNDLQTFFQDTYEQSIANIQTSFSNTGTVLNDPSVLLTNSDALLSTAYDNLLSTGDKLGSGFGTELGSFSGGLPTAATDLSALSTEFSGGLDPSLFAGDLTSMLDPANFTAELSNLLGGSAADGLTSLLAGGALPDLFTTFATDFATSLF